MGCSSDALEIDSEGTVQTVGKVSCFSIPNTVVSFKDGDTNGWVFRETASTIDTIDFTNAKNLERIGSFTFFSCIKVAKFDLSPCTSLSYVGICSFRGCSGATEIILPESPLQNISGGCFSYCSKLETFNVPSNVKSLDADNPGNYGVFTQCTSLKSVTFAKNSLCERMMSKVFWYSNIEVLSIPEFVNDISGFTFRYAPCLKKIEVDEKNKNYYSSKGVLYTTKKELVYYPQNATSGDTAKIDDGTVAILSFAFVGTSSYKYIEFPSESLTELKDYAFYNFGSLVSVTFPASFAKIGVRVFQYCSNLTNVTFLNSPTQLNSYTFLACTSLVNFSIPNTVTILGNYLFDDCSNLNKVYIPSSVKTFGTGVFGGCSSSLELIFEPGTDYIYENGYLYNQVKTILILYLGSSKNMNITSTVNKIDASAFQGRDIETIAFENIENITTIGSSAFQSCKKLKSIKIPNIETINAYTFESCSSLTSMVIPSSVKTLNRNAFCNCIQLTSVQIDGDLQAIKEYCFERCSSLSECNIPNSVKTIGEYAFRSCSSLTSFKLPSSLSQIGQEAFSNSAISSFTFDSNIELELLSTFLISKCNNLITLDIPGSVSCIAGNAIYSCDTLETISLSIKLNQIENYAISNCPSLEKIIIGDNNYLRSFYHLAFSNCPKLIEINADGNNHFSFDNGMLFNAEKTMIILFLKAVNPKTIIIPETVKRIYMNAFSGCTSIENVTIECHGLTSIGMSAFQDCTSLKYINFPYSLASIASNAFSSCNIRTVSLVSTNITSIEDRTFANNKQLNLIVLPTCLSTCSSNAFENTGKNVILFYHGSSIITNTCGVRKNALVFCFDQYKEEIFLGLPVRRSYKKECSIILKRNIVTNNSLSVILVLVLCS